MRNTYRNQQSKHMEIIVCPLKDGIVCDVMKDDGYACGMFDDEAHACSLVVSKSISKIAEVI